MNPPVADEWGNTVPYKQLPCPHSWFGEYLSVLLRRYQRIGEFRIVGGPGFAKLRCRDVTKMPSIFPVRLIDVAAKVFARDLVQRL